ncbi:MAG: MmcB family DNA repair protein [Selenomonadaceae bacterium]|nr:MmcB family DNA repair protein [Selenomonadaceae bacterium]
MKSGMTMKLERALYEYSGADRVGIYGCFEVSLGCGYGNERVDFMTMDSKDEFRCYEIKSSEEDFTSDAKLSFVGDYNYLLITYELYELKAKISVSEKLKNLFIHGIGLLIYDNGKIKLEHKAKKKNITTANRIELMHSMIRSLSRYCIHEFD